jgi:hypothetical protein
MRNATCTEGVESLTGAMERTAKMPDCRAVSNSDDSGTWDEGNVWFDDWGKWEKCDDDR